MPNPILRYFAFAHLPENLQKVSRPIGLLAEQMDAQLPDGPEKSAGLRKLLEAKDCLVRASLDAPKTEDCPHAAPHRYCAECVEDPCPIGLGKKS